MICKLITLPARIALHRIVGPLWNTGMFNPALAVEAVEAAIAMDRELRAFGEGLAE